MNAKNELMLELKKCGKNLSDVTRIWCHLRGNEGDIDIEVNLASEIDLSPLDFEYDNVGVRINLDGTVIFKDRSCLEREKRSGHYFEYGGNKMLYYPEQWVCVDENQVDEFTELSKTDPVAALVSEFGSNYGSELVASYAEKMWADNSIVFKSDTERYIYIRRVFKKQIFCY